MPWRIVTERPDWVDRRHYILGGPHKVGFSPVWDTKVYVFVNERTERAWRDHDEIYAGPLAIFGSYSGAIKGRSGHGHAKDRDRSAPLGASRRRGAPGAWFSSRMRRTRRRHNSLLEWAGIAIEDALVLVEQLSVASAVTGRLGRWCFSRGGVRFAAVVPGESAG